MKVLGFMLLAAAVAACASASTSPVPEIDAASAGSAFALVAGALLVYRGRRK